MVNPKAKILALSLLSAACALSFTPAAISMTAAPPEQSASPFIQSPEAMKNLVRDVYQFAYPLVLMDITMRQATNVPDATSVPKRAPINQFTHYRSFPDADSREVVRFNFDTLYSMAWLDVRAEPVVLSLPDTNGRYHLMPMLDMWTDVFAVPGSRTTGNQGGDFAIASADWTGELPDGVELIRAPTPLLWILGRTQTDGPQDYPSVHQLQDSYRLTPLSQWGKEYTPPSGLPVDPDVDNHTAPQTQVNRLTGVELLTRFAELLKTIPTHANDYPIVHRMRALGIEPGQDFRADQLGKGAADLINSAAREAFQDMQQVVATASLGVAFNGWNWEPNLIGTYGTAYRHRAVIAWAGLGANLPEDATYPNGFVDSEGRPLSGEHRYVLRFEGDQLPPADAFWSLTIYDKDGFQIPNPLGRFALSSHNQMKFGADGAIDLSLIHI